MKHFRTLLHSFFKPAVVFLFLVLLVASPRPASAQVTVLGDVQRVVQGSTGILDQIFKGLQTSAQVALKNGLRTFFDQIAYDTAVWIGSGDNNQKPLLFTADAGKYLEQRGDAALGEFLDTLGDGAGIDLCNLPQAQGLKVEILVNRLFDQPEEASITQSDCSVTQIAASAENSFNSLDNTFTEAKIQFAANPTSVITFANYLSISENPVLAAFSNLNAANVEQAKAMEAAQIERLKSDFKDKKTKVSEDVDTPAEIAKQQNQLAAEKSAEGETTLTGNVIADSLNIFTNTLLSKLMDRAKSGLLSFFNQSDINESLRGSSSTSRGGGIQEARLQFASYKTPPISSSGTLDILSQFTICPSPGADVINCVITNEFSAAIEQQKTVKQLVEETNIGNLPFGVDPNGGDITDPNQGISLRNAKILRQYSVVPVGWELAAEYRKKYGSHVTLRQVMEQYNNCDADNYSPYCGLIDPDWVLKSPEVFCKVDGYAENIGATSFIDTDGNPYTPQDVQVNRLKSCVDSQTCLSEDDTGACQAYGYCTKQEDIYRFQGESCPAYQASCELFTDNAGSQVGYLKNTLNYNGCTSESDGCAWRCSVYNTVDQDFQCNGEDSIYKTCTDANGCRSNLVQADGNACSADCSIANGGFRCSAEDQTCYLPGSQTNTQYSINFDDDIQTCNDADQSCATFIPQVGSNLIANPSFESFNNFGKDPQAAAVSTDDFGGVALAFAELDGSACVDETGGECRGWLQPTGGPGWRVVTDSASGRVAVQSEADSSTGLTTTIKTGMSLANRSFVLSYNYINNSGQTCQDPGTATASVLAGGNRATGSTQNLVYSNGSEYQSAALSPITFGANVRDTDITVIIGAPRDCSLIVDNVSLIEITNASVSTAYQEYSANAIHLKTTIAEQCSPDEVGCQLYTPKTGASETPVPGRVTNPLSEACGNGSDFTNPACSQCLQQFVGCQAFVEEPTPYQAPLKEFAAGLEDAAEAIAKRTGFYCEGTSTSCNPSRATTECGAGVSCIPSISVTPSSGQSCSAQDVGCEQYVNIDKQGAGGESLEYYSYIRQCVKPTETQIQNALVDTYYSFEGSDQTGYQIRSWYLKKSNIDAGPCTNLDLTGGTAQSADAACVDDDAPANQAICSADELGVNPDCTEYFDANGNRYYRLRSATITVSDSCTALRNSQDSRIYYTIPNESQTCSASANLCREYKGAAGNNQRFIVSEQFDGTLWGGGTSSSTVASANNGQSMQIGTATNSSEAATVLPTGVSAEKSYVARFWAKGDAGKTVTAFVNSPSTGVRQTFGTVNVTGEWQLYSVGPFVSSGNFSTDTEFGFSYNGSAVYIDNVEVFENNSTYMIAGTATSCNGFEGCQEYQNQNGQTSYLKSFEKLCDEKDAGCTALFNTQNSSSPFTEVFHTDNEKSSDDVIVSADTAETRIVKPEALCDASTASCSAIGLPTLNADGGVAGYTKQFLLNDPDFYTNSLCTNEQLSCKAYAGADGSIQYFKDPGNKICEYDEGAGAWKTKDGDPCPLQNPSDAPSQPKGPVCNNGPREGLLCSSDSECPTADDGSISRCVSNLDANSGWVGQCNPVFAGCTNYLDPNSDPVDTLRNTSFETDVLTNSDTENKTPDSRPDYWSAYPSNNNFKRAIGSPVTLCSETGLSDKGAHQFTGQYSLKVQAAGGNDCIVANDNQISVDPNKIYTLSGKVYVEGDAKFAVGLIYQNYSTEIATDTNTPESYAIAAYDGGDRGAVETGKWISYHAVIGPNQLHQFPAGTTSVRVFVESFNGRVFFDDVELAKADVYSYINSSVDGAPQADANTCNGTIDEGQGCVPFQELTTTSNTTLSTLSDLQQVNSDESATAKPCQTRASDGATVCGGTANAADSNVVLQVKRDRQCSQWLTCDVSDPVNINGQIVSSCLKFTTCTKLNPDTGQCIQYVDVPGENTLGTEDALQVVSQPGAGENLQSIKDYSGYAKVGIQWLSAEGAEVAQSQGYYPVDWMPERGKAGVKGTQDLIPDNDFEAVSCNAEVDDSSDPIVNATFSARDLNQTCTLDTHCRVQATETAALTALKEASSTNRVADIDYSAGWCQNVNGPGSSRSWKYWSNYNNAEMAIIDYDEAYQYETTTDLGGAISNPYPVAAKSVNLNNVLYVQPTDERESGITVNITAADISAQENYVLSFDAKYIVEPPADTEGSVNAMTAFLRIGTTNYFFTESPQSEPFRLSTQWKNYSIGPVAIGSLNPEDAVSLYIAQADGAKNTPFLIDNISLKPALEVAPQGGIAGSKDVVPTNDATTSQLIGRSCRSYPAAESASCNYTDKAGVIYTGWKGYCLEADPLRPNGCIAWWPVTTITGESDLTRSALKMRWTDQAPVYHCLVAKGNEDLGFCAGPGISAGEWCNTSADCVGGADIKCVANEPAGTCEGEVYLPPVGNFAGAFRWDTISDQNGDDVLCNDASACTQYQDQYNNQNVRCNTDDDQNFIESSMVYSTSNQNNVDDYQLKHSFQSKDYSITHTLETLYVDRDTSQINYDGNNKEHAVFLKLEPEQLRLEQLVHISEIADIRFYDGTPIFDGSESSNNYQAAKKSWDIGSPLYGGDQDLASALSFIEKDGAAAPAPEGATKFDFTEDEKYLWDIFRQDWSQPIAPNDALHFQTDGDANDRSGVFAVQTGLWCGLTPCSARDDQQDELEDADFIYVKGVGSLTDNPTAQSNILFSSGHVANGNVPLNPFQRFAADLGPDSDIWEWTDRQGNVHKNRNGQISQTGPTVAGYTPATENQHDFFNYFVGRNMEQIPGDPIVPIPNAVSCFGATDALDGTNACGANIFAVKFDFDNGYLKNVYIIGYNGFRRADVREFQNISWSFDLKEVCVFAVQSADDGAGGNVSVMPWRTRVNRSEEFKIPGLGYTYQLKNGTASYSNILFGMLALRQGQDPSTLPNSPDYNGGKTNITGKAGTLPLVYAVNGLGTGLPFACIGSCTEMVCQQTTPYTPNTFDPNNGSTCREGGSEPQWISLEGICVDGDGVAVVKDKSTIPCDPGNAEATQTCRSADARASRCQALTEHEKAATTKPSLNGKLEDAVASAWERYRTIFANLGTSTVYTIEEKGLNEDRSGSYQHSGILKRRSLVDLQNYTSLQNAPTGLSGTAQAAFPNIANTLSEFSRMPICANNRRTSDTDYCAILPTIDHGAPYTEEDFPITVNGQTDAGDDVYMTTGTKAQIQFGASVDADQQPLNQISIQYEANPRNSRFEDYVTQLWEAAPLPNHTFEHVYTCDSTRPEFSETAGRERDGVPTPACVYELRVQLKDYWGFCNLADGVERTHANATACDSYTKFNKKIIVELAQ